MADHFRSKGYGNGNNRKNYNNMKEDVTKRQFTSGADLTESPSPSSSSSSSQERMGTSNGVRMMTRSATSSVVTTSRPTTREIRRQQEQHQFETSLRGFHPNDGNNDHTENNASAAVATAANHVSTSTATNLNFGNRNDNQGLRNNISTRGETAFGSGIRESVNDDLTNNAEEDDAADEESGRSRLVNMKDLVEDENTNGEMRPNKLFPVKNEKDVLLRKVRSVLNKVSSVNYHRLRKRWLNMMPSGDDDGQGLHLGMEQIGEVTQLVIAKALDDTIYMHIYAGMMGYVVARKPPEISSKIRQLTNAQLHHELQKLTTDKELALFDRCTERVDATRRKKVTLHRFIAELYGEKACTSKFLYERVRDLLIVNNPSDIDENVECLCVLMTFAGQKLEEVKKDWVEDIFKKLAQRQTETPQMVSKRIQFMILDLVEMRGNGWSPHNKWWSPSVQIAPQERRERIQSSPGAVVTSSSNGNANAGGNSGKPQNLQSEEPPKKLQRKQQVNNNIPRSRTVSEGSGIPFGSSSAPSVTHNNTGSEGTSAAVPKQNKSMGNGVCERGPFGHPHGQTMKRKSELTDNQNRALMALLNKVSPYNLDRIAYQLYEVLNEDTMEDAVNFIVDKILDDSFYTRTHASLIKRVSNKPNMKNFGLKIGSRVMRILERNSDFKDGFQFLAELYNLNLVTIHQVRTALEWLMNCSPGMISSCVESLVIFLFIAGAKLEADVRDELWMNRLIEFWEKKANLVAHNQGRPMCLLQDVIELRQNKWTPVRQPHWIPPTIDLPTIRFEPESLIRLFQSDRMEFLRFVKGETSTLSRIERFSKEALEYGVRHGNYERDPEFLKMTGVCLRVLIHERLLRRGRLENFLGTFVSEVITMKRRNSKAWENLGLIMNEVY